MLSMIISGMTKLYFSVLLLLTVHLDSLFVIGQSTVDDSSSDEENKVNGLYSFVKDLHMHNSVAWTTLTKSIQSEFQNLNAQISRLEDRVERHDIYLNNSRQENRRHMQTANTDTKAQISRLENRIESHNTNMNNSIQENRRQIQAGNIDAKAQISRLETRIESHNTNMNNSIQENRRQMQTANTDTKVQISRLENRIESHNTNMNNSIQENRRQMQTANTDMKAQISRLEYLIVSHNTYMSNSVEEIKRQLLAENMEMKNEFQGLIQKLPSRHCPTGFNYSVAGSPKCYAVLSDRVDWTTAQQKCRLLHNNAQLAVMNSTREQQIITEMLLNHDCIHQNNHVSTNEFWIGAQRRDISDCNSSFVWTSNNGTTFPIQYSNWNRGEPNCDRHRGVQGEACASTDKRRGCKWNDLQCTWYACPLCEITVPA